MKLSERNDLTATFDRAAEVGNMLDVLIPDGEPDDAPVMVTVGLMKRAALLLAFMSGYARATLPPVSECSDDPSTQHQGSDAHGTGHDIG
ncbi:hypothetical protein [Paraburkholderia sp. MM5477-R1]|uniref:hypothetical protein n=1 Tax=Paraburkholderia sp. MM5477-R1 TaxID=2991062 RepID=UPI003D2271FD